MPDLGYLPDVFETYPELRETILTGLTDALLDENPDARRIALLNLGRVGDEAFRAVPRLVTILHNDPEPELRQLAASVLGGLGTRTLPFLIRALVRDDQATTNAVKQTLTAYHVEREAIVPALLQVSSDEDPLYRYHAVTVLFYALDGRIERNYVWFTKETSKRARETFERSLNDSDEMVRLIAAYALWIVYRDTSGIKIVEAVEQQSSPNQELAAQMLKAIRLGMEND